MMPLRRRGMKRAVHDSDRKRVGGRTTAESDGKATRNLSSLVARILCVAALAWLHIKERWNPSKPKNSQSVSIFSVEDAVALYNEHQGVVYGTGCIASFYVEIQEQMKRWKSISGGLSEAAIGGFILAASEFIRNDSHRDLKRLGWFPPTDAIMAGAEQCSRYPYSGRNAQASSLLYRSLEESTDEVARLCVKHAINVNIADSVVYRRDNGMQIASVRGLDRTFHELEKRGADPFYSRTMRPQDLMFNYSAKVRPHSVSWLRLAAQLRPPPRSLLNYWIIVHTPGTSRSTCEPKSSKQQKIQCDDAIALGVRLVKESQVDSNDHEEINASLGRLYSCSPGDLTFAAADFQAHPELSIPRLGYLRPLDAALAGGCDSSLTLLKRQYESMAPVNGISRSFQDMLLDPCGCSSDDNHGPPSKLKAESCYNSIGMDNDLNKVNQVYKEGFYCDSKGVVLEHQRSSSSAPPPKILPLDLLLIREWEARYNWISNVEKRRQAFELDQAVVRILNITTSPSTMRLQPVDVLALVACYLQIPNATLAVLELSTSLHTFDPWFGRLSLTWAENMFSKETFPPQLTPSLALQCLLQHHPPSKERDRSEEILKTVHLASLLRSDLIPASPFKPGEYSSIFDMLRRNISLAYEHIILGEKKTSTIPSLDRKLGTAERARGGPFFHLPISWQEPQQGEQANIFHALFYSVSYGGKHWCDWDWENFPKSPYKRKRIIARGEGSKARAILDALQPHHHKHLLNVSVRLEIPSPRESRWNSNVQTFRAKKFDEFQLDSPPVQQCYFLSTTMPVESFGITDVVLESVTLHAHSKLRQLIAGLEAQPERRPEASSPYANWGAIGRKRFHNIATPLAFAFSQYINNELDTSSAEDGFTVCHDLVKMILDLVQAGATVCEGGRAFSWEVFTQCAARSRNPRLIVELLRVNPRVFHCDPILAQNRALPSRLFGDLLKALRKGKAQSTVSLISFVVQSLDTLLTPTGLESAEEFVAGVASSALPESLSFDRVILQNDVGFDFQAINASFGSIEPGLKQSILQRQCYKRRNGRSSFAARAISLGFWCPQINQQITFALNGTETLGRPIKDCGDLLPPFWQAVEWDLKNAEIDMQRPLHVWKPAKAGRDAEALMGCNSGIEAMTALDLLQLSLDQSQEGNPPIPMHLVAQWAASRDFIDVLDFLTTRNESLWTKEVVMAVVRERNLRLIARIPEFARKWLFDAEVVDSTSRLPPFMMHRISQNIANGSIMETSRRLWVRLYQMLEAVGPLSKTDDERLPWLRAVTLDRDFFPFVDDDNRSELYEDVRRPEMLKAAAVLSKHLGNQTTHNLSQLLVFASSNWFNKYEAVYQGEFPEMFAMSQVLLGAGAEPHAVFRNFTSLTLMNEAVATRLWDAGARPVNSSAAFLCLASFHSKMGLVERAVRGGNEYFGRSGLPHDLTPLHCAACSCNSRVLDLVLSHDREKYLHLNTGVKISEDCPDGGCRPLDLYKSQLLCEVVFGSQVWETTTCVSQGEWSDRLDPEKNITTNDQPPDSVGSGMRTNETSQSESSREASGVHSNGTSLYESSNENVD